MIDKNKLNRIRRVSHLETGGSTPATITETVKQAYAKKKGLVFQNGQFLKDGVPAAIRSEELQDFANQYQKQQQFNGIMGNVGQAADMLDKMLFAGNSRVNNQSSLTQGLNAGYDTAANVVSKVNPMVGCVCAGTRIINKFGEFINIENLTKEKGIIGWDTQTPTLQQIELFKQPELKECLQISFANGESLRCSLDHPILFYDKKTKKLIFKEAGLLNVKDYVGLVKDIDIWGKEAMPLAYIVGLLIGDGHYSYPRGAILYSQDPDTWAYLEQHCKCHYHVAPIEKYPNEFREYVIEDGAKLLSKLGIYGQVSMQKTLPELLYIYNKESICALLAGLWDSDGSVSFNSKHQVASIMFCQISKSLILTIKEQLLKLGIHTYIEEVKAKTKTFGDRHYMCRNSYKLKVSGKESIINFYKNIHLNIRYKQENLEKCYQYAIRTNVTKYKLSSTRLIQVKSIKDIGQQYVYNLQVGPDHTYIANGVITHNSIMKAGGFASDALTAAGIGTDQQTTADKILDSKFLKLTPVGLVNAIGASSTQDFSADTHTIERVGGSYGGTVNEINEATEKAGKKYGLFSSGAKKKANQAIDEARRKQNIMTDIADTAQDQAEMRSAMSDQEHQAYLFSLQGGYDQRYNRAAKEGMKFPESKFEPELLDIKIDEPKINPGAYEKGGILTQRINVDTGCIEDLFVPEIIDVESFKKGGTIEQKLDAPEIKETDQKNIIPEGALHRNKHHIEGTDDFTQKGIPVIDKNNNQQAEIEKEEIIFTKEVTDKLEELCKVYFDESKTQKEKDAAAIDAGKLLTKEINLNTDDRAGLLDKLQDGGTIEQKKPSYADWLKGVNPDYVNELYDLEKAFEVVPFDRLERWRNETNKVQSAQSKDVESWHLPSIYQIDENTIVYLKKGKTTKDNSELEGEFNAYANNPEFKKLWKMVFNKDENRWYYKKRK